MEPKNRADSNSGDTVAVAELIADIEGEIHLHIARVQEFLDGTTDFAPVMDNAQRDRLEKLRSVLSDTVCALDV